MNRKQNLDDFLREMMDSLPNSTGGGFEHVEKRMKAKNQKGILLLFLVPFLFTGLYWMVNFTEQDLVVPSNKEMLQSQETYPQQNVVLENEREEKEVSPSLDLKQKANYSSHQKESSLRKNTASSQSQYKKTTNVVVVANSETSKKTEPEPIVLEKELSKIEGQEFTWADDELYEEDVVIEEPINTQKSNQNGLKNDYVLAVPPFNPAAEDELSKENEFDQFPEPDVRETSNWSVTLNFYPNYTFREFKINNRYRSQVNERYEDIINTSEKGGFAVNVGVDVRYHLGDNLFLGTGLSFIQTKITGAYEFEVPDEPVFDEAGNIYMYAQFIEPYKINEGIIQTYRFAQIPLHVSYQPWASKKVRLIIEGGFSYIRFLSADGTTIDHQTLLPRKLENMEYNKNLASLDFKVGMTYYVTPDLAFGLEPTLMYFNSSIYKENSPVYVVPWSVGVNFNFRLKLF